MYEAQGQLVGAGSVRNEMYLKDQESRRIRETTIGQNIDNRIASLTEQIERLQRVKMQLADPSGLLNVAIEDLRFAMNY